MLISFFNYADRQAIFPVFPLLEREMNLSPVQLGVLGSAFAWVYGLSAPFAGMIVDRVKRKTAIIGGLHAWSVICMATVLSTNVRHLVSVVRPEARGTAAGFTNAIGWLAGGGSAPIVIASSRSAKAWDWRSPSHPPSMSRRDCCS